MNVGRRVSWVCEVLKVTYSRTLVELASPALLSMGGVDRTSGAGRT